MKYLCLAYGDGKDWEALSSSDQEALLAQDELLRAREDLVAPVGPCTTVRVVGDHVVRSTGSFAAARVPLAGFSLKEVSLVTAAMRWLQQVSASLPSPGAASDD